MGLFSEQDDESSLYYDCNGSEEEFEEDDDSDNDHDDMEEEVPRFHGRMRRKSSMLGRTRRRRVIEDDSDSETDSNGDNENLTSDSILKGDREEKNSEKNVKEILSSKDEICDSSSEMMSSRTSDSLGDTTKPTDTFNEFDGEVETDSLPYTPHSVKHIVATTAYKTPSPSAGNLISSFSAIKLSPMTCSESDNESLFNEKKNLEIENNSYSIHKTNEFITNDPIPKQQSDDHSVISILSDSDEENNIDNAIDCDSLEILTKSKTLQGVNGPRSTLDSLTPTKQEETISAWAYDDETREYFLSDLKHSLNADDEMDLWPNLKLPKKLYDQLFDHQKGGVQWMATLHSNGIGGILGDDMGMGKTFQTLTFLGGLMREQTIKNALIVAPVSLLRTWEKEARNVLKKFKCVPAVTITVLGSDVSKTRRRHLLMTALGCKAKYPHLVITTYGLVGSSPADLLPRDYKGRSTKWDYVVLDEGHKIKNPSTKVFKGCQTICAGVKGEEATKRLLLTGTPIQNNLKELWALFDWATSGKLLGKLPAFRNQFAIPIEEGRHKDAIPSTIRLANKANKELQKAIQPHFLQRLKKTTFGDELPTKKDLVVWTHLSTKQRTMYEDYLMYGRKVQKVLSGETKSPLEAITYLKKICGHPTLIRTREQEALDPSIRIDSIDTDQLVEESAKLQAVLALVDHLHKSGHRMLLFSQSTKMLDILEKVLQPMKMGRIDGKTKERDRQYYVDKFNSDGSNLAIMLLSTKAAGLGLTLTGADRAIIYDPSWNPAEDSQAVDRCYRIGQTKAVTVYRLITAGTVEERMYEKQVHKDGIRRAILTNAGDATERHFSKDELRRMFTLEPIGKCDIIERLGGDLKTTLGGSGKSTILQSHHSVIGITSHDLVYTREEVDIDLNKSNLPFASTPLRAVTCTPKQNTDSNISVNVMSDSNSDITNLSNEENLIPRRKFESNENNKFIPLGGGRWKNKSRLNREAVKNRQSDGSKSLNTNDYRQAKVSDVSEPKNTTDKSEKSAIKTCFMKVDELVSKSEHLESCMNILLDLLETEDIDKAIKLQIHMRIARVGNRLGWL